MSADISPAQISATAPRSAEPGLRDFVLLLKWSRVPHTGECAPGDLHRMKRIADIAG